MKKFCGKITFLLLCCLIQASVAWAQPVADFIYQLGASGNQTCIPVTAGFTNNSSADAVSFEWAINGSVFSNQENPIRNFDQGGTYTVCLTVANATNQTDSSCQIIRLYDPPSINLVTTNNEGCVPITPSFNISSDVIIDSIYIDYGDGKFYQSAVGDTALMQTHTFSTPGTYSIGITIWDVFGCESTTVINNVVQAHSYPAVSFDASPLSGCQLPHDVSFVNTTPGAANMTFEWLFGDGGTSTETSPTHSYLLFGNYTVTLIGTNTSTGCTDTLVSTDLINIGDIVQFDYTVIDNGNCSNTEVNFTNQTSGTITSILWDFGDGNVSTDINPTHIYTTEGCYFPQLSITTAEGCISTKVASACIDVLGPVSADYTSTGNLTSCNAAAGLQVDFAASASKNATYAWDFGGLGTSNNANTSFLFDQFGVFPVALTVTYINGCQETIVKDTVVIEPLGPVFTSDTTRGCAPLPVQFTNLTNSSENIVNYFWDFGFTTSNLENPNIVFSDTGRFDVKLVIESASGCRDSVTYPNYIWAGMKPAMEFSADPLNACIDTVLTFTDETSNYSTQWYWNFGDGGESYEQNPSHEYNDTGHFDITLIAWNNGCTDTLVKTSYVEIKPPKAIFSYAQNCSDPNSIVFTDNSIGADVYEWDFGDGQTSSVPSPTHIYTTHGTYTVQLTVYNTAEGCDDFMIATINVTDASVNYSIGPPNTVCAGDSIQITNTTTGAIAYAWDVPDSVGLNTSNSVAEPFLRFDYPGIYSGFSLTVADANGCIDTVPSPETITVSGIDVDLTVDRLYGCPPLTVNYSSISQSFQGNIVSYAWDFGDSNTSTDQNPTHTYQAEGLYTVTLTVTNDEGCVVTRNFVNLIDVSIPVAGFSNYLSDCVDYEHTFVNTSTGNHLTYRWDFGDGDTSILTNPVHSFRDTGRYIVCVEATNGPGCENVYCDTLNITEIRADFTGDNLYKSCPFPPLVTNFTDESVGAVEWVWDFGDGTGLSTLQNPTHAYGRAGVYSVCLIVTDILGCRDTLCRPDYVRVDGPDGAFSPDQYGGCSPDTIEFTAMGRDVAAYNWDFGDGNGRIVPSSDTINVITHTYTAPGKYVPVLILEDPAGCSMPYRGDTIIIEDLSIGISSNVTDLCHTTDSLVDFTANINYFGTLQEINWVFTGANPDSAIGQNVNNVIYNTPGTYDVSLQVATTYCDVSISETDLITVHPRPEPAFSFDPMDGCEPLTVIFTDQSTIAFDQIIEWAWDFGDGQTSNDQHPTHVFEQEGTYTIRLTVTSDASCTYFTEQDIIVHPRPVIQAGESPHLCLGESFEIQTELIEGSSVTYSWSPTTNLSCTDCPNPVTTPVDTILYTVTVTNQFGCTASDSILVTAGPYALPQVQMNRDTAICFGTTLDLLATADVSPAQFDWTTSTDDLSCIDCPNPVASPLVPTTYVVYVTGPGECMVADSVFVDILIENIDPLGIDRTICEGGSVELMVQEGTQPAWSPSEGLSCSDCPDPIASPVNSTTYQLSVIGNLGCTVTDSVTVNVMLPGAVDAGPDTSICFQDAFIPNASFNGNSVWTLDGQVVATDQLRPELFPETNSTYEVVVTNDLCVLSDQVSVTVLGPTTLAVQDQQICEGDSVQLIATGNGTVFQWTPTISLNNSNISDPMARPTTTTTYTVTSSVEGCWSISEQATVTVLPLPTPYPQRTVNFKKGEYIQLDANVEQGSGGYIYEWKPGTYLSCTDCEQPISTPDTSIRYEIWVEDQNGCVDSAAVFMNLLQICTPDLFVMPTAFTPNNDGLNDFLQVQGHAEVTLFQVYNRWGELIYSGDGSGNGWDGSFKGKKLNRDVFVYYIEGICPYTGDPVSKSGDITLLR